ncbi:MAG: hypothetical protein Q4C98_11500, partial [Capnocytophaga sp.]|nr:hypothetical protein [Capnocytophaga sp.]
ENRVWAFQTAFSSKRKNLIISVSDRYYVWVLDFVQTTACLLNENELFTKVRKLEPSGTHWVILCVK